MDSCTGVHVGAPGMGEEPQAQGRRFGVHPVATLPAHQGAGGRTR